MNRTIEEIKNYFEENPELRDSLERGITKTCSWGGTLDGVIDQMRGNFPQEYRSEEKNRRAEEIITLAVVDIIDKALEEPEKTKFAEWYIGEWKEERVIRYKGFNSKLQSSLFDFQYEVGKEYEVEGTIKMYNNGFHACQDPLHVLAYHDGWNDRFCIVEQWGYMVDAGPMSVSSNIKIVKEISLRELFEIAAENMDNIPFNPNFNKSRMIVPSVGEWDWKVVSSLPSEEAVEGSYNHIILRQSSWESWVMGIANRIGIMRDGRRSHISGENNEITVLGNNNIVDIAGKMNQINIMEGEDNKIVVSGEFNKVRAKMKVNVVCVGEGNSVIAGIGSTLTFISGEGKIVSAVIDGKENTENEELYFEYGYIKKRKFKDYEQNKRRN